MRWTFGKYVFFVAEGTGNRQTRFCLAGIGWVLKSSWCNRNQDGSTAAVWLGERSLGPAHSIINQPQPTDVGLTAMSPAYRHAYWWWRRIEAHRKRRGSPKGFGVGFRSETLGMCYWTAYITMPLSWASTHTDLFSLYTPFASRKANFLNASRSVLTCLSLSMLCWTSSPNKRFLSHCSQRAPPTNLLHCVHICCRFSDHMVEYANRRSAICAPESSDLNVLQNTFKSNAKVAN